MKETPLKAPFPAFGGKARVAGLVWSRLGDVSNYIEPFANSAAVLLGRPHPPRIETLNDLDCYIANFWRATRYDPEAVAEWADWPVNEADLHANHRWLVLGDSAVEFRRRMRTDPDYFDPKVAGRWVQGLCCWIGSGWCEEREPDDKRPHLAQPGSTGRAIHGLGPDSWSEKRPKLCNGNSEMGAGVHKHTEEVRENRPKLSCGNPDSGALGSGVHANAPPDGRRPFLSCVAATGDRGINVGPYEKRPQLNTGNSEFGRGVHSKGPSGAHRPQLADAYSLGRGVHSGPVKGLSEKRPFISGGTDHYGMGVHAGNPSALGTCAARRAWLIDWFSRLRDRLRTVRVCCGDWLRVCDSPSVTTRLGLTGVFLDPPYSKTRADGTANRSGDLYANDGTQDVDALVAKVRAWCLERGPDPLMRIVLAGYEGEGHEVLEDAGWTVEAWRTNGGYGNRSKAGNDNPTRERLWFSPHCVHPDAIDYPLFAD